MRKLAPLFLTTSIIAFAAGNAMAMGDYSKKHKAPEAATGSPTVPANSQNPQGNSYSDKSSSAPGTNAKMEGNAGTAVSPTASTAATSSTLSGQSKDTADALANEDKKVLTRSEASGADRNTGMSGTSAASSADTNADKHNKVVSPTDTSKKAKKKVAKADTNAAAAESSTGKSPGTQ